MPRSPDPEPVPPVDDEVDPTPGPDVDVGSASRLDATDFVGRCDRVAASLVGALLLVDRGRPGDPVGGVVVETEAYLGDQDPACHLTAGRTDRTEPLYRGPGTVYVFQIYGHCNLNLASAYRGHPECVLIRALRPTHGLDAMRERRERDAADELASGPGKLTEALGVTRDASGRPLGESSLRLYDPGPVATDRTTRVGISTATDWPLRWCRAGGAFASTDRPSRPGDHPAIEGCYRAFDRRAPGPITAVEMEAGGPGDG